MRWSFRTNGNYIDFVHTDETSEAVENTIFHLHNTSRCVSWSLLSDTTRINFTIDETKYANILITDIDFDGTVMNSQDDFETGITAMFAGLASSPGGDSGLLSATVELTDAQIKALPTTAVEIVPAPGANKVLSPTKYMIHSYNEVAPYTNVDNTGSSNMFFQYGDPYVADGSFSFVNIESKLTDLLAGYIPVSPAPAFSQASASTIQPGCDNQPIVLTFYNNELGNFTGGNAGNTLKVTVFYVVINL